MICPDCNSDSLPSEIGKLTCKECKSSYICVMDRDTGIPYIKTSLERKTYSALTVNVDRVVGHVKHLIDKKFKDAPEDIRFEAVSNIPAKSKPFCPNYYRESIHLVSKCEKCQELLKQYKDGEECSFCSNVVPRVLAQPGIANFRVEFEEVIHEEDGYFWVEDVPKVKSRKVIACPNCADRIKPVVNRDGKITNHNVKTYSKG